MGFPFASGHYLALRRFPATAFAPGSRSVWHRDPAGSWAFYATTPGQQGCARYFSAATPRRCGAMRHRHRLGEPVDPAGRIEGLLGGRSIFTPTVTRVVSAIGRALPERA